MMMSVLGLEVTSYFGICRTGPIVSASGSEAIDPTPSSAAGTAARLGSVRERDSRKSIRREKDAEGPDQSGKRREREREREWKSSYIMTRPTFFFHPSTRTDAVERGWWRRGAK